MTRNALLCYPSLQDGEKCLMSIPNLSRHGESQCPLQQVWTMAHQPGANPLGAGLTVALKAMAEEEAHQDLPPASQVGFHKHIYFCLLCTKYLVGSHNVPENDINQTTMRTTMQHSQEFVVPLIPQQFDKTYSG